MSLDLDADCLISELAPIPSLVQRFGRANRHLRRGLEFHATLLVYEPESPRPYSREELDSARRFVLELSGRTVSQADLASALAEHCPLEAQAREQGRFLNEVYGATVGSFREEEAFTEPAVLDSDLTAVQAALRTRSPFDGLVLSLPAKQAIKGEERPSWLPAYLAIAPSAHYHAHRGYVSP